MSKLLAVCGNNNCKRRFVVGSARRHCWPHHYDEYDCPKLGCHDNPDNDVPCVAEDDLRFHAIMHAAGLDIAEWRRRIGLEDSDET